MIRSTAGLPHLIHLIKPRVLWNLILCQECLPFPVNLLYGATVIHKDPERFLQFVIVNITHKVLLNMSSAKPVR